MQVVSDGSFAVASVLWRPDARSHALTIVCKATYRLRPEISPLATEQEPPCAEDHFSRAGSDSSLYAPSDLVPARPRADVVLVGRAYAPGAVPCHRVLTRLVVGAVDKRIEVLAHRYFEPGGRLCWGPPFKRMSLWYERAAGGRGTDNPVGIRLGRRRPDGRTYLPNLQPPLAADPAPNGKIPVVSYGPIAPEWPSRRRFRSPEAGSWNTEAWWESPLPPGLDLAFFNAAPLDQQASSLRADQRIVLENLLPTCPILDTRLCGVAPRAVARRATGRQERLELRADTLWLDTVRQIATLTWRGRVELGSALEEGRVEVSRDPRRKPLRPPPPRPRASQPPMARPATRQPADEVLFDGDDTSPTLKQVRPEEIGARERALAPEQGQAPSSKWGFEPTAVLPEEWSSPLHPSWTTPMSPDEVSYEGVPGVVTSSGWTPRELLEEADNAETLPGGEAAEAALSETATLDGKIAAPVDPLPFRPAPPSDELRSQGSAPAPVAPQRSSSDEQGQPQRPPWVRPTALESLAEAQQLRARRLAASPWESERPSYPPPRAVAGAGARAASEPTGGEPPSTPPEPPPLLGPLATYEMVRRAEHGAAGAEPGERAVSEAAIAARIAAGLIEPPPSSPPPTAADAPDSAADQAAGTDESDRSTDGPADQEEIPPVERCAAIAASIDRRPDERDAILAEAQLERERWEEADAHWSDAISAETSKGRSQLLRAYDSAYVEQLEEERGPLEPAEYAQLVLGAESGDAGDALAAHGLPRSSLLRIERVMLKRMADDAGLAKEVRQAIQAAREG
jgi:hypothetical protein